MITVNGIQCQEIIAQHGEGFSLESGASLRKGFYCSWSDRFAVARGLLGLASVGVKNGPITLHVGLQYPEVPLAFCRSVSFEPQGTPRQGTYQVSYPNVIVWAEYGSLPWLSNPQQMQVDTSNPIYAEQELDSSSEYISFPGRALKFSSGQKVGQDFGIRVALVEFVITFHQVPYIPTTAAFYAGTINNAAFFGAATGRLMFNGVKSRYVQQWDGSWTQNAIYSFTYRVVRWDYGLNPDTGNFEQITTATGGNSMLQSIDFNTLFPTYNVIS